MIYRQGDTHNQALYVASGIVIESDGGYNDVLAPSIKYTRGKIAAL
jgi:hypothetical protein